MKKQRNTMVSNSRRRGVTYEQKLAQELRDLGFDDVVTSRQESKAMDDNKVDFVSKEGKLPLFIQAKKTENVPSYFKIRSQSTVDPKKFCIIWNKQSKKNKNFCSEGECVILDKELFYELIKNKYLMEENVKNQEVVETQNCVVSFTQNNQTIKIKFAAEGDQVSYAVDMSECDATKVDKDARFAVNLAGFMLAALASEHKRATAKANPDASVNTPSEA